MGVGPERTPVLKRLDEDLLHDVVRGGYVVRTSNLKNKNGRLLPWTGISSAASAPTGSTDDDDAAPMYPTLVLLFVLRYGMHLIKSLRAILPGAFPFEKSDMGAVDLSATVL